MINIPNRKKPIMTETNEKGCLLVVSHYADKSGHIFMRIDNEQVLLHRYVYEIEKGQIPEGLLVRHTCDNPNCINSEHLILGTINDNVQDRVDRDRSAKGASNGRAKLNEDDIKFIRSNEDISTYRLAKDFNVTPRTIRLIRRRVTWSHIE